LKAFEDEVTYDFTASDGVVIKLRRMSDRQRTRFQNFTMASIHKALQDFLAVMISPEQMMTGVSVEDAQPSYDHYRSLVMSLVKDVLVDPADLKIMESWDHPGDYVDFSNIGNSIMEGEFGAQENPVVPPPDKVDGMDDKEIERLGESSGKKSRRASTSPSLTPAATSSSGTESLPDATPAT
jgi:hypothetical protein